MQGDHDPDGRVSRWARPQHPPGALGGGLASGHCYRAFAFHIVSTAASSMGPAGGQDVREGHGRAHVHPFERQAARRADGAAAQRGREASPEYPQPGAGGERPPGAQVRGPAAFVVGPSGAGRPARPRPPPRPLQGGGTDCGGGAGDGGAGEGAGGGDHRPRAGQAAAAEGAAAGGGHPEERAGQGRAGEGGHQGGVHAAARGRGASRAGAHRPAAPGTAARGGGHAPGLQRVEVRADDGREPPSQQAAAEHRRRQGAGAAGEGRAGRAHGRGGRAAPRVRDGAREGVASAFGGQQRARGGA